MFLYCIVVGCGAEVEWLISNVPGSVPAFLCVLWQDTELHISCGGYRLCGGGATISV